MSDKKQEDDANNDTLWPITPDEVISGFSKSLRCAAFKTFNTLIKRNFNGKFAEVKLDEVIRILVKNGFDKEEVIDHSWLEVENGYKAEWKVSSRIYSNDGSRMYTFSVK